MFLCVYVVKKETITYYKYMCSTKGKDTYVFGKSEI